MGINTTNSYGQVLFTESTRSVLSSTENQNNNNTKNKNDSSSDESFKIILDKEMEKLGGSKDEK